MGADDDDVTDEELDRLEEELRRSLSTLARDAENLRLAFEAFGEVVQPMYDAIGEILDSLADHTIGREWRRSGKGHPASLSDDDEGGSDDESTR